MSKFCDIWQDSKIEEKHLTFRTQACMFTYKGSFNYFPVKMYLFIKATNYDLLQTINSARHLIAYLILKATGQFSITVPISQQRKLKLRETKILKANNQEMTHL